MTPTPPEREVGASERPGLDSRLGNVLGGRTAAAFHKAFGLETVRDLLEHFPRRYALRGELTALGRLPEGENVTIVAEVSRAVERKMRSRHGSILEVTIRDATGVLTLTFFNQSWRAAELVPGARGFFTGKVTNYHGTKQLTHPDYELFEAHDFGTGEQAREWAEKPVPIYPATASVPSWKVEKAVALVLDGLGEVPDPVPPAIRSTRHLIGYREALEKIHRPASAADYRSARAALTFQEAFILQLALLEQRALVRQETTASRTASAGGLLSRFDSSLPFALTADQRAVGDEIATDLSADSPMNRLIQGEVGSGKTIVALRAMLQVADSGGQSAFLAPTEVLAAQHLRSIVRALGPGLAAELMPVLLTGQLSAAERRRTLLRIVSGQSRIVIGTHALLGESVSFYDLGLVVVDEQHRFGVEQRDTLRQKGRAPHVLVMTATPIPRTVAMTVFGDLDVSTIRELPGGRQPIESFVVPLEDHPGWIARVWERAAEEIAAGHQVFVVCPAIAGTELEAGETDAAQLDAAAGSDGPGDGDEPEAGAGPSAPAAPARPLASVETTVAELRRVPVLAGARIGVLHGRLSPEEKDEAMRAFAAGELDLIVATTVIEVGVDVPNASAMIVLDADRFGVSQLHQLRGRVGRGAVPGLCLFVTGASSDTPARSRVEAVAATTDGFELARVDLEQRREGDVLGRAQSGARSSLRLLRVVRDGEVIEDARAAAADFLSAGRHADSPSVDVPGHLVARLGEDERAFLSKN
jgi:ATP-dependent DNA helicase RecG